MLTLIFLAIGGAMLIAGSRYYNNSNSQNSQSTVGSKREDIPIPPIKATTGPEIKDYKNKEFISYQNGYKYFQRMFSSGYSYLQSLFFTKKKGNTGKLDKDPSITKNTIPEGTKLDKGPSITEATERLKQQNTRDIQPIVPSNNENTITEEPIIAQTNTETENTSTEEPIAKTNNENTITEDIQAEEQPRAQTNNENTITENIQAEEQPIAETNTNNENENTSTEEPIAKTNNENTSTEEPIAKTNNESKNAIVEELVVTNTRLKREQLRTKKNRNTPEIRQQQNTGDIQPIVQSNNENTITENIQAEEQPIAQTNTETENPITEEPIAKTENEVSFQKSTSSEEVGSESSKSRSSSSREKKNFSKASSEEEGEIPSGEEGEEKKSRRRRLLYARLNRYRKELKVEEAAVQNYGKYDINQLFTMMRNEKNQERRLQMKLVAEIKERTEMLKDFNSSIDAFEDLRADNNFSRHPKDKAMFVIICKHSNMDDSSIDELRRCLKNLHINYDTYSRRYLRNVEFRESIGNSLSNNKGKDLIDILASEFKLDIIPKSSSSSSHSTSSKAKGKGPESSKSTSSKGKAKGKGPESSKSTSSKSSKSSSPLPGQQIGPYTGPKSFTSDSGQDIFNIYHDPIPWTYIFIGMTIMSILIILLLKYIYKKEEKILRIEGGESKWKKSKNV
jgi:hypothetical protein